MRSITLVVGQFSCIAVLLLGGGWALPWWAWLLFAAGWALVGWAAVSLGVGNFTVMPEPSAQNTLIRSGIYRHLRHPMYAAVILCGLGVTLGAPSLARWIALPVVVLVLVVKVRYEERALTSRHAEYPKVMSRVARLVPGIW